MPKRAARRRQLPGLRDRGADRIGRGAGRARLSLPPDRGRLDGSPTLIIIDEGWLALDDPTFAGQLREWLKTLRKKNASVVFATQSLADIESSAIAPAIIESCPTRIFLPNERAFEPQIAEHLSPLRPQRPPDRDPRRATPKRDYYCQSRARQPAVRAGSGRGRARLHRRLVQEPTSRHRRILDEHGRDGFAAAWLRHRGLDWAAELLGAHEPPHPQPRAPTQGDSHDRRKSPPQPLRQRSLPARSRCADARTRAVRRASSTIRPTTPRTC